MPNEAEQQQRYEDDLTTYHSDVEGTSQGEGDGEGGGEDGGEGGGEDRGEGGGEGGGKDVVTPQIMFSGPDVKTHLKIKQELTRVLWSAKRSVRI